MSLSESLRFFLSPPPRRRRPPSPPPPDKLFSRVKLHSPEILDERESKGQKITHFYSFEMFSQYVLYDAERYIIIIIATPLYYPGFLSSFLSQTQSVLLSLPTILSWFNCDKDSDFFLPGKLLISTSRRRRRHPVAGLIISSHIFWPPLRFYFNLHAVRMYC